MGLLDVTGVDKRTLRRMMNEAFELYGTNAKLYEVATVEESLLGDEDFKYKNPVDVSILFDDNPKMKLSKLGWLVEGESDAYLAYILPLDKDNSIVRLERGALIEIPFSANEDSTRKLFVGEVRTDSLSNICYICKLSQNRIHRGINPSTGSDIKEHNIVGNNYFKES